MVVAKHSRNHNRRTILTIPSSFSSFSTPCRLRTADPHPLGLSIPSLRNLINDTRHVRSTWTCLAAGQSLHRDTMFCGTVSGYSNCGGTENSCTAQCDWGLFRLRQTVMVEWLSEPQYLLRVIPLWWLSCVKVKQPVSAVTESIWTAMSVWAVHH